uniref:Cationic amino acid transporter n=1 Tax=Echinococcus granulosus TaxID=6210 RepID=A0A068WID4_ECHGR|nr:cationic amino acid transporter [Echinococcus granulosus]
MLATGSGSSAIAVLVLAVGYQFYSDLFALIELAGFAFSFIAALAVASLLYMRYKEPNLKTSFQLPIFLPILFLGCDFFILVLTICQQPRESLSNVILMLAAVPIYWCRLDSCSLSPSLSQTRDIRQQKAFALVAVMNEAKLDGKWLPR